MNSDIACRLAHDLNNQMTLILNHLRFAASHLPPHHAAHHNLTSADLAAERCTQMIGEFMHPPHRQSPVANGNAVLTDVARLLRASVPPHIELVLDVAENLGAVAVTEVELHRVLFNLVTNACEAMPQGGSVTLTARRLSASVVLKVADTGCGMSPALRSRIFEPRFTTKRGSGGSGLGLAIVSEILARRGARLTLKTAPGKGSSFRIAFPVPE